MVDIPGYDALEEIGRGGFAVVYKARQPAFNRTVAIKVVTLDGAAERGLERFLRECQAAGSLSWHPGVVTVYDAGETGDGRPFLVMEFLAQGTLADRVPLPWREAVEAGIEVADALQAAHDAGLIHRDVKPENVLLGHDGRPLLADFGIAALEEGESLTRTGQVTASVRHAPPEVLDGKGAQRASDIWSLASTIHTLIRGQAPFVTGTDDTLIPLIGRIARDDPPDLVPFGVPEPVQAVLRRAMEKDPARRWASAATFAEALRAALDEPVPAAAPAEVPAGREGPPRWRRVVAPVLLLVVLVVGGILLATSGDDDPPVAASSEEGPAATADADADGAGDDGPLPADAVLSFAPDQGHAPALDAPIPSVVGPLDGQPATETALDGPMDVVIDAAGLVVIAEPGRNRVVRIEADGTLATLAGSADGCSGDPTSSFVPAVDVSLCGPERLALDVDGTVLIGDAFNQLIRRVDGNGLMTPVAGDGFEQPFTAIGGLAVDGATLYSNDFEIGTVFQGERPLLVGLTEPRGMAVDPRGVLHIAEAIGRIARVVDGQAETAIGRARAGETAAVDDPSDPIANPWDVDFDAQGRLWLADPGTGTVRYRELAGPLETVDFPFGFPTGVAPHPDGSVYVADGQADVVWRILPDLVTVERVAGLDPGG